MPTSLMQPHEAKSALVRHRVSLDRIKLYAFTIVDFLTALTVAPGFGINGHPTVWASLTEKLSHSRSQTIAPPSSLPAIK